MHVIGGVIMTTDTTRRPLPVVSRTRPGVPVQGPRRGGDPLPPQLRGREDGALGPVRDEQHGWL